MAVNLKQLSEIPERLVGGHRLCAGCGASIAVRQVFLGTTDPIVTGCATGCLEVATTIFPYTAWNTPFIHNAFENVAATMSGVETAYRSLKKRGKIQKEIKFVAFGGDGGTYDIGLQSLSGMLERGHRVLYVCYDNEGYMNTGIQRSSATPQCAHTTTAPAGKVIPGKPEMPKDLTQIVAAHNIPYAAQASISHWNDLITKAQKAFAADGPSFINIFSPCHRGWRMDPADTVAVAKLAVDTGFWPLYEVENGKWKINFKPRERKPIIEYLKTQGRFKHLLAPGNEPIIDTIQKSTDEYWQKLEKRCSE